MTAREAIEALRKGGVTGYIVVQGEVRSYDPNREIEGGLGIYVVDPESAWTYGPTPEVIVRTILEKRTGPEKTPVEACEAIVKEALAWQEFKAARVKWERAVAERMEKGGDL